MLWILRMRFFGWLLYRLIQGRSSHRCDVFWVSKWQDRVFAIDCGQMDGLRSWSLSCGYGKPWSLIIVDWRWLFFWCLWCSDGSFLRIADVAIFFELVECALVWKVDGWIASLDGEESMRQVATRFSAGLVIILVCWWKWKYIYI